MEPVVLGGLVVVMLAIGSKVRGLKTDGRWIFKGDKKSLAFFSSEGK
jgi:hypothetical protein